MQNRTLTGLYAITDATQSDVRQLISDVEQSLQGGVRILQYRDKTTQHEQRLNTAKQLRQLTQKYNVLLIINDDVTLAKESDADGVHLGADDASVSAARTQLGDSAIIGVSCYNDFRLAEQATNNGADYIAFGRFFSSRTKPHAVLAHIDLVRQAKRELDIPIVAIGGITSENGGALTSAGAHMLAVVNNLFAQADIKAAAQRYNTLFTGSC